MKRPRVPPSAAAAVVAFAFGSIGPASSFHLTAFPRSPECGAANPAHHVSQPPPWLAVTHPRGTKNTALNLFRNRRGSSVEKDNDLATDETESTASSSENRRGDDNDNNNDDDENTDRRRRSSKQQRAEGKTKKLSPRQLRKLANHPLHQAGQTFVAASVQSMGCLLYTSPSPRDVEESRMPSSA